MVKDRPGIIASLATILSQCGINIDAVVQKTGLPEIAPALSDYAGGMQGVARGPGITANQLAGFPGAALFASANSVGGTLSYSAAPYRLGGQFSSPGPRFSPLCGPIPAGRSPPYVRRRRLCERLLKKYQSTETPICALSFH